MGDIAKIFILMCAMCFATAQSKAGYVETVKVRYHENYSVTSWISSDVEFVTGTEITQRVSGYFPFMHAYAIIPMEGNSVIVLQLEGFKLCSFESTRSCFPISGNIKGYDKQGRTWEICRSICY